MNRLDLAGRLAPPLFAALGADFPRVQAPPVAAESASSSRHGAKVRPRTRTWSRPLWERRCCVALPSVLALAAHHLPTPGRAAPHTPASARLASALLLHRRVKDAGAPPLSSSSSLHRRGCVGAASRWEPLPFPRRGLWAVMRAESPEAGGARD